MRVGGLVSAVDGDHLLLDDGTATGELVLVGEAAPLADLLETGDAIGATGRVVSGASGPTIEVGTAADLVRLGDLGEALPIAAAPAAVGSPADGGTSPPPLASTAGSLLAVPAGTGGAPEPAPGPLAAGIGLTLVVSGGWAVAAAVRRRRERSRLTARIAARLAAVGSVAGADAAAPGSLPVDGSCAPPPPTPYDERGPSVRGLA